MMSDGQRSRLIFAMLAMQTSGVLLLDEPTNHLDIDAVDGLAAAIKAFQGVGVGVGVCLQGVGVGVGVGVA